MDDELVAIARAQEGLLSAAQLESADLTEWQRRRLVTGWLTRVAPGVYAVRGVPDTHRYRLRLGLLALGERSWVSYEAAATLHTIDRLQPDAVAFTIDRNRRRKAPGFTVHTTTMLEPIDCVVVDGFRTMSATRTVIDLAHARIHIRRVEAAIDRALLLGLSSPFAIADRLASLRGSGRWGSRLVDDLIGDTGGHTMIGRRFLELVRAAGLPQPDAHHVSRRNSRRITRIDVLFDDLGVVVELVGRAGASTAAERARDAQRRNELQELGRRVYEFTWEDVTERADLIRRTIADRFPRAR